MPRIYLDVCCLNRPFDDQTQDRIRLESEAVILILARLMKADDSWIGSEVMQFEVSQTPVPERRRRLEILLHEVHETVTLADSHIDRGKSLEALGFHAVDALHLACAESAQVDVFLTTDDRLLRRAARIGGGLNVRVENPLTWLREASGP